MAALLAVTLMLSAGCAASSPTGLPAGETGYLFRDGSELIFVRWDGAAEPAHGSVDWYHGPAQRITADFTVTAGPSGFSLEFPAGSIAGWTGTFTSGGLNLVIPDRDGGLRTISLTPATTEAFDAALASLR